MRPGNSASSVLNRSATCSGAWFGSITPPEPTRMCDVDRGDLTDHDVGRGTRDRRQVVMLGDPVARVAEAVGELAPDRANCAATTGPEPPVVTGARSRTERGSMRAGDRPLRGLEPALAHAPMRFPAGQPAAAELQPDRVHRPDKSRVRPRHIARQRFPSQAGRAHRQANCAARPRPVAASCRRRADRRSTFARALQ